MKIGTAVVGLHIAVLCAFALTQGCVTTESSGSGRGAGAKHKGPFRHEHTGKVAEPSVVADPYYTDDTMQDDSLYADEAIITSSPSTVEPAPVSSYQGTTEVYIVQKGDILSQLAVDFDTTTATLVQMNGLSNPDVLYVGQELRVPAGRGAASKTTTKSTGSIKKGGTYTIQKGDTLSEIALAAGVSIDDLRQLNGIKGDTIMAGDTIDIPSYGKVPSTSRKAPKPKAESTQTTVEPAPAEPTVAPMAIAAPATTPDAPATSQEMSFTTIEEKIVYPGETLDDISRQYGVSKGEILRLNNLTDESQVKEGQRLRIPVN